MAARTLTVTTDCCRIALHEGGEHLWSYRAAGANVEHPFAPPVFEIDGRPRPAVLSDVQPAGKPAELRNGAAEHRFTGRVAGDDRLTLEVVFRVARDNPVCRFRYVLHGDRPCKLTKTAGRDNLTYLAVSLAGLETVKEVAFSQFNYRAYTYTLSEQDLSERHFENGLGVMGPMLVARTDGRSFLVAYEHGSTLPDAYLRYHLSPERRATLRAVKGNYYAGQPLGPDSPYETIWMQCAAVNADEDALAAAYRTFVLRYQTENLASRKPYIFYNTWGNQGRAKGRPGGMYRDLLNLPYVLNEIDVAHRMGIDVFVLDAGWFSRTGDWPVDRKLFPDNLATVKAKLDGYGMKLGLWFSTQAALSSPVYQAHRDCAMSWRGTPIGIWSVWETEESQHLCLVSRYADAFADELIRLARELGVTYFKWDAFGHYGCDEPHHLHGDAGATIEDRGQCYTFLFDRFMTHVADRIGRACPEAILDFDITEPFRNVGLGFLASGKYFLINDGPYVGPYNKEPHRARNCRVPLTYDKWIPSICFLTHYLPDDPAEAQVNNVASLILGPNGLWGDIVSVSPEGADRIGRLIRLYKQVRDDVTDSTAVIMGSPGDSPEIYEKLSARGRGVVCVFSAIGNCADTKGAYMYVTRSAACRTYVATEGVRVSFDAAGRAVIRCAFERGGAKIVFFGAEEQPIR